MCGIAGIYRFENSTPLAEETIEKMLAQINYRGPDESGIYINNKIGLGSVRLSIIDLANGQQPMSNQNGSLWIVFNGEIFNYIELRNELQQEGYTFRTSSDTEVLLQLYEKYGEDCLNKLNGQFAFAVWNTITNELFLARDRVGIRPLFYTQTNGSFIFGSEIKAILGSREINPEMDYKSLSQIFTFWTTLTPATIFKNIFEVPPGHFIKINSNKFVIKKYWELNFPSSPTEYYKGSLEDAIREFDILLKDSIQFRLRADVPVAAYLSGGIDSSATTALIKDVVQNNLQTFSIGFADKEFDESLYQKEVSQFLKTNHTGFTISNEEISDYFQDVIWHTEIPIIRTAPVPMFSLSKQVHNTSIKVVVTGEGADEALSGYNIFKEAIIREFWSKQPDSKLRPLLLQKLYPYISQMQGKNKNIFKFFYGYKLGETHLPYYSHLLRWKNTSLLQHHFADEVKAQLGNYNPIDAIAEMLPEGFDKWELLSRAQWLETKIFMSGYLLSSQGDRMAMANSVEGRYPFLDHRLLEFCATLPSTFKLHGLNEKYLLKKYISGRIPESVVKRSKQAYRAPVTSSFIRKNAPEYLLEKLSEPAVKDAGIFNFSTVDKLLNKLRNNAPATEIESMMLAGILSTQIINEKFIHPERGQSQVHLSSTPRIIRGPISQSYTKS
ncbi:MAG: asparagine synthase (glutamine-hydrolyzing) [Bacteroidales bacterium]|nr:asparagine synthase (glutamine-hydrolyzing) [Bacteroidales bacterium]